jgi:hypothetical protein
VQLDPAAIVTGLFSAVRSLSAVTRLSLANRVET